MAWNKSKLGLGAGLGAIIVAASLASGCASGDRAARELAYVERPVETLYTEATNKLEKRRYSEAAQLFDEVERQHPYTEWARRAMLMSAYSNYKMQEYEAVITACQRFLSLHPGSASAPYAHYLIGVSYYEQILDVGRDQAATQQALAALQEVVNRYPETEYARDAQLKIDLTRDHLAGKELAVGRYYLKRNYHVAALNRFKAVVENYGTTSQTPEALHRMVEAYTAMGLLEEAKKSAAVLGYNYPGSEWYGFSYELLTGEGVYLDENDGRGLWANTLGRLPGL